MQSFIEVTKMDMLRFSVSEMGLYNEILITTNCIEPIFMIDRENRKLPIASVGKNGNATAVVTIKVRNCNGGDRWKFSNASEMPINGMIYQFPVKELVNGPLYIRELDMMFASANFQSVANHPRTQSRTWMDEAKNFCYFEECFDTECVATLRVHGNDPTGVTQSIWAYMGGAIVELPVYNCKNEPSGVLFVVRTARGETVEHLADWSIIDDPDPYCMRNGMVYYVGRSEEELAKKIARMTENWTVNPVQERKLTESLRENVFEKYRKDWEKDAAAKAKAALDQADAEKRKLELDLKKTKNDAEAAKQAQETAEAQAKKWKDVHMAQAEADRVKAIAEAEEIKTKRERSSFVSEIIKNVTAVAKVVIPIVVAAIGFFATMFGGKKLAKLAA